MPFAQAQPSYLITKYFSMHAGTKLQKHGQCRQQLSGTNARSLHLDNHHTWRSCFGQRLCHLLPFSHRLLEVRPDPLTALRLRQLLQ